MPACLDSRGRPMSYPLVFLMTTAPPDIPGQRVVSPARPPRLPPVCPAHYGRP